MRIGGVSVLAVLTGALAHYVVGFLFYGVVFVQLWQQNFLVAHGAATPEEAASLTGQRLMDALLAVPGQMQMASAMALGFVVSVVVAAVLGALQAAVRPAGLFAALRLGALVWLGFAATTLTYNITYSGEPLTIYWIDLGHTFLAYSAASAVVWLLRGRQPN